MTASKPSRSCSSSTISSTIVTGTAVFKRWLIWPIFTELIKRVLKRDEWYWEKQMHEICVTTIWRLELQVEAPWPSPAASNALLWSWMDKATLLRKAFTVDSMISFHMQLLPPLGALVFFFWRPLQTLFKNFNLHIGVVPGVVRHCLNYFFPLYLVTLKESINFLLLKQDKSPAATSKF